MGDEFRLLSGKILPKLQGQNSCQLEQSDQLPDTTYPKDAKPTPEVRPYLFRHGKHNNKPRTCNPQSSRWKVLSTEGPKFTLNTDASITVKSVGHTGKPADQNRGDPESIPTTLHTSIGFASKGYSDYQTELRNDALLLLLLPLLLLHTCSVLCGNHANAAQRRHQGGNCGLSRFCCCTHTSRRFMLVSCSRDVFIRLGQLRVVLANIAVWSKTQKKE